MVKGAGVFLVSVLVVDVRNIHRDSLFAGRLAKIKFLPVMRGINSGRPL